MSLFDELENQIGDIFSTTWDITNGQKIPEVEHVGHFHLWLKLAV
jgi:hypothetical protein